MSFRTLENGPMNSERLNRLQRSSNAARYLSETKTFTQLHCLTFAFKLFSRSVNSSGPDSTVWKGKSRKPIFKTDDYLPAIYCSSSFILSNMNTLKSSRVPFVNPFLYTFIVCLLSILSTTKFSDSWILVILL